MPHMQKTINVLEIPFTNTNLEKATDFILETVKKEKKGYVCTPNPEMLLEAKQNESFKRILQQSLLNIPDGIGILWAATHIYRKSGKLKALLTLPLLVFKPDYFKHVLRQRVTGVDLVQSVLCRASKNKTRCFFLGAEDGVAKKASDSMQKKYPGLSVVGTYPGSPDPSEQKTIINIINKARPDILFVAYGAPAQEQWIAQALPSLKTVSVALGIGGTFDFIAGKRKRSPRWIQKIGLEWLYRLIQEPSRWKRIYNATIRFPYVVISSLGDHA
jgi:N-acetylglucosaminyldiphosphoundecaprenol N-acetyl-beta-D-mannosaminyltransferase